VIKIKDIFGNRHAVLPVIHVETLDGALYNTELAQEHGCDGAFLIAHRGSSSDLLNVYAEVSAKFPDFWMGINCLDLTPVETFAKVHAGVNGIWVDNAQVDENIVEQVEADKIDDAKLESDFRGLYFGGVAFKYQRPVEDLKNAMLKAAPSVDVITTSGAGTGQAAEVQKIAEMRSADSVTPLAIASGITVENVSEYLPIADCFLVATGISRTWVELDPDKTQKLVDIVRDY